MEDWELNPTTLESIMEFANWMSPLLNMILQHLKHLKKQGSHDLKILVSIKLTQNEQF